MNDIIIKEMSKELSIREKQIEVVLSLLEDGNTIPFIARYRKEATGALNEEVILNISEVYEYQVSLMKRKEDVIRLIDEKGLMTDELKQSILACSKLVEVEDIYRPFKEKKKTKATEAIALGLEPLAKKIMSFPVQGSLLELCDAYLTKEVPTVEDALMGARYIIAEWISDNASYRKWIRRFCYTDGVIVSKLKKDALDDRKVYEMYYDYQEAVNRIRPHRILALNRGEKEEVLSVTIDVDQERIVSYLEKKLVKNPNSFVIPQVSSAIRDSLKRLILPSVIREVRRELKEQGEVSAIDNFSRNVEKLLLTPPISEKVVLGFDPAFRTGCKLAVLDKTGKPLDIAVIYPTEPRCEVEESKRVLLSLIDKYHIDIVAIGNGTASRESEAFVASCLKEASRKVSYIIVSEAGASVYSASSEAISEFPELTVEKRSAISIGRRLQDALSELVKIDPKSIGVGLYQHDVPEKKLDESLDFVVSKTVNQVGVNVNTASRSLLQYVSGLTKKTIDVLLKARDERGKFASRDEIKKLKGISPKVYEQSIGFMRIVDGTNPLDKTSIHPDNYPDVLTLLSYLSLSMDEIGSDHFLNVLNDVDLTRLSEELKIDVYTLEDIVLSLKKPNRDPRDDMPRPLLRSDILSLDDLHVGDHLQGTVRNVVDFGAFIDVGLHEDGLAHISKLSREYIKHPSDVVSVGDIVDCYVIDIQKEKKKVSLSLLPLS